MLGRRVMNLNNFRILFEKLLLFVCVCFDIPWNDDIHGFFAEWAKTINFIVFHYFTITSFVY